ncbi:HAD family hydrolase, partial [Stenotrophomonas sp.]
MKFPVLAITLDLDDTLWPFAPIGARIDQVLYDWMREHSPATAAMYPVAAMRELRERSFHDNPQLHHDLSALRRLTLREALENSGADLALLEPAYEAFYAARNQVEFYPDALDALARIAAKVPVAALSNGNADLQRIGLAHHFSFQL